jgi:asparagine synthase (glutamine-hydrolysing)
MIERLSQSCPVFGSDFRVTIRFRNESRERKDCLRIPLDFGHGSVLISPSRRTIVVTSRDSRVSLMLDGELYLCDALDRRRQAETALERYLSKGLEEFARSLNGTFVLVIVDDRKDVVHVITDRLGFRKVFFRRIRGDIYLASSPSLVPADAIDPVGALTYLSNSFIFSGRTVRADVRALDRAAIHRISRTGVSSSSYWQYDFPGAEDDADVETALLECAELMRQAVRRRIPSGHGRIFVSLSGGIDSRAVLGCLLESVDDRRRIMAFSYGAQTDEDVVIAQEVAKHAGVEHRNMEFSGDLESTIRKNAALGEGLVSFYTHGIDALVQLANDFTENDVLFVGETPTQRGSSTFADQDDVLVRGTEIRSPMKVPAYFSYGEYSAQDLQETVDRDIADLKRRISPMKNLQDARDFLFLDQRTSNMLLPWREFLAGRFITVCDPFLDNDILDFYRLHSRAFRHDKSLHRIATQRMFPELCQLGFAARSGVENSAVHAQIVSKYTTLERLVYGFPSGLDALLPPAVVSIALRETYQSMRLDGMKMPALLRSLADKARRRHLKRKLSRKIGRTRDVTPPCLGPEQIERLLTLRLLLALQ